MEILSLLDARIARLAERLKGRRVGVYPAAHGRFARDLGARLSNLDISGLYHPDEKACDQGLRRFGSLDEFLDASDAVLAMGLDAPAARMFHAMLARSGNPPVIDVLDPLSPDCLLGERSALRFADFLDPSPGDRALMDELGLDREHLRTAFKRDADLERRLAAMAGAPAISRRFDGVLNSFDVSLLENGLSVCPCPHCGKVVVSNQAFPIHYPGFNFLIAHRYVCHEEFYLFKGIPVIVGMYLPRREAFISAMEREESMRQLVYEPEHLVPVIERFKLSCLRHHDATMRHARPTPKKRLALFGNWTNFGHHVRNELACVQAILDAGMGDFYQNTLITFSDIFQVNELFPELPPARRLQGQDPERVTFEAHRIPCDEGLLPVMLHYGGDFQESLARRMMQQARQACRSLALDLAERVGRSRPAVWVTLRSTRAWISQNQGLADVLARLYRDHPTMAVVFDGMPNERERMLAIRTMLPQGLVTYDALNLTRFETIHLASRADAHISPLGSGATFLGIVNTPGVFHGGKDILDDYLLPAGPGSVASLPRENPALNLPVRAVWEDKSVEMHVRDYELNADELYEAVATVLERSDFRRSGAS